MSNNQAAVSRIEELEASLTKFDKLESELKRVEGVLGGLGVKFDEADGSMQDLTVSAPTHCTHGCSYYTFSSYAT